MIVLQGAYTCRVLSSFLHSSPLVCRVELATESVYLESSCNLEIFIVRGLSARPTAGGVSTT